MTTRGLDIEHGLAGGAGLAELILRSQHGRERRDLGLAVEIPELDRGQTALQFEQHLHRHDRGAVIALLQGRQIGLVEVRRAQHRDPDRRRREERGDPVRLDQRQDVVGGRLAGNYAGGAEIHLRAQEHIQLRAMIQRQSVQELVLHAHAAVDDAADILPHHGFMGQHRTLRQRFRARGVDDLREIAAVDRGIQERAVGMQEIVEAGEVCRRHGRILARQPDHLLDRAILCARRACRTDEIRSGRQQLCAGALQDEIDLVRIEHEVDRHQHRADPRRREA
ncbi:hypothetical protein ABIA45_006437 [Bradyrhizobium sp. USDA 336]